jgi:hypothetical protein
MPSLVAVAVAVAVADSALAETEPLRTPTSGGQQVHLVFNLEEMAAVLVVAAVDFAEERPGSAAEGTMEVLVATLVRIWFRQLGLVHMSAPHRGLLCSPMRQCRTTLWLQPCHRWCRQQLASRQIPALGLR